jgi:hypothetical protein
MFSLENCWVTGSDRINVFPRILEDRKSVGSVVTPVTSESGSVRTRLVSHLFGPLAEHWISREPYDART